MSRELEWIGMGYYSPWAYLPVRWAPRVRDVLAAPCVRFGEADGVVRGRPATDDRLVQTDGESVYFPVKSAERVAAAAGHRVRVADALRTPPDCGVFRDGWRQAVGRTVAAVKARPTARVLVGASSRVERRAWHAELSRAGLPMPVNDRYSATDWNVPHVSVVTWVQLDYAMHDLIDLVVVTDVRKVWTADPPRRIVVGTMPEAIGLPDADGVRFRRSYDTLWYSHVAAIGFLSPGPAPRPRECNRLSCMFGKTYI
jgi:hypothetical protein